MANNTTTRPPQHGGTQQPGSPQKFGAGLSDRGHSTGIMEQARETVQDAAQTVAEKAGEYWGDARQGIQQAGSAVADTTKETYLTVTGFMGRYPLATFAAGCVVGALLMMACPAYHFEGRDSRRN